VSNTYQKKSRRAQPDSELDEVTVPEQVTVSMAEIAESAKEGLLALAVGTGLQVMTAMFDEDVTRLCGAGGKHNADRTGYRHGTEAGSVTLGGRRIPVTRPRARAADGSGEPEGGSGGRLGEQVGGLAPVRRRDRDRGGAADVAPPR